MDILTLSERVRTVSDKLAELARQRQAIDTEALGLLEELRHLGQGLPAAPPTAPVTTWGPMKGALEPAPPALPERPAAPAMALPAPAPVARPMPALPSMPAPLLKHRVILVLAQATAPMTKEAIGSLLDEPPVRIGYCLTDMRRKYGFIDIPARGMYALTTFGQREAERIRTRG